MKEINFRKCAHKLVTLSSMCSTRFSAASFHSIQKDVYCLKVNMFFVVQETSSFLYSLQGAMLLGFKLAAEHGLVLHE